MAATSVNSVPSGEVRVDVGGDRDRAGGAGRDATRLAHDTVAPLIVQPVTGRGVSPAGRVSVTTTSVAVDGPSLRYSMTYSTGAAADTAAGPVLVTERSATGWRATSRPSSLSSVEMSRPPEPAKAMLVIVVSDGSVSTMRVAVTVAPTAIRPRLHDAVTAAVSASSSWQVPCEAEPDTNVSPGARVSERLALGATVGPLLTTMRRNSSGSPATGFGVTSSLVTVTSAWATASTVAVAELSD